VLLSRSSDLLAIVVPRGSLQKDEEHVTRKEMTESPAQRRVRPRRWLRRRVPRYELRRAPSTPRTAGRC
jgi:hypothetical protein